MNQRILNLTYEVELQPGETFTLPEELISAIQSGRWRITIQPISETSNGSVKRDHQAFLNGFVPEDEGLYDDYSR